MRCVLILNAWVSVGVAFSESQHDHPENSHDCCHAPGEWNFTSDGAERSADGLWPAALMAAVGLAAAGGMVVRPSTATGTCMATIRITATTGIGITKQIAAEA